MARLATTREKLVASGPNSVALATSSPEFLFYINRNSDETFDCNEHKDIVFRWLNEITIDNTALYTDYVNQYLFAFVISS